MLDPNTPDLFPVFRFAFCSANLFFFYQVWIIIRYYARRAVAQEPYPKAAVLIVCGVVLLCIAVSLYVILPELSS